MSNALLLLLMRRECRSLSWRKCGNLLTVQSGPFSTELSSESQSSAKTFPDSFQAGRSLSLSEDTLMVINTSAKMLSSQDLESLNLSSLLLLEANQLSEKSSISKVKVVLEWECTILMSPSQTLLTKFLLMHWWEKCQFNSVPRTLS